MGKSSAFSVLSTHELLPNVVAAVVMIGWHVITFATFQDSACIAISYLLF